MKLALITALALIASAAFAGGSLDQNFGTAGTKTYTSQWFGAWSQVVESGGLNYLYASYNSMRTNGAVASFTSNWDLKNPDVKSFDDRRSEFYPLKMIAAQGGGLFLVGLDKPAGQIHSTIAVMKINPDGSNDTHFGTGGLALAKLTNSPFNLYQDNAIAGFQQPDGKLVITYGLSDDANNQGSVHLRFLTNGCLDPKFGKHGLLFTKCTKRPTFVGQTDFLKPLKDGSYLSLTSVDFLSDGTVEPDMLIRKITANGTVDQAFGKKVRSKSITLDQDAQLKASSNYQITTYWFRAASTNPGRHCSCSRSFLRKAFWMRRTERAES